MTRSFFDRIVSEAVPTRYLTDADNRVQATIEYFPDSATVTIHRTTGPHQSTSGRVLPLNKLVTFDTPRRGATESARKAMTIHRWKPPASNLPNPR